MIVTIFRSRLHPDPLGAYEKTARAMSELAQTMPGYVAHKGFVAEDGERVTIVEFETMAAQRAWAEHPAHRFAQRQGRESFYSDYSLQVCELVRISRKSD